MAKSCWMEMSCDSDRDKAALKTWFSPLCDDMTPTMAEVLVDCDTDREKKLRASMTRKDGSEVLATRTLGKRYSITLKPVTEE